MTDQEIINKLEGILKYGSGDVLIDFMIDHDDRVLFLMNAGAKAQDCGSCGARDDEDEE